MKTYIWVEIKTSNKERFFLRCRGLQINVFETRIKDNLEVKILESDYSKLKKIWFIKTKKKEVVGLKEVKKEIKKNKIFFIFIFFGLFFLFFVSHIIIEVDVIHSNKEIRELVTNSLEEYGIKENSWRKNYKQIEIIKEKVLNDYPEKLEWLEIEQKGMKYIVRVEERKIEQKESEKEACNIVATKSGIIKEMIYYKGEAIFKVNDSVKVGDILISGIIKKDEEEKSVVCAEGKVFAEVWYTVRVSIPITYEEETLTGKVRWNLKLKNNGYHDFIFKSRLQNYQEDGIPIFTIFGNTLSFVKQKEISKTTKTYTEEESLNLALEYAHNKISSTLDIDEEVLMKKVLKKELNNSTMNVEVFVTVKESIGSIQEFEKNRSGESNDTTTN